MEGNKGLCNKERANAGYQGALYKGNGFQVSPDPREGGFSRCTTGMDQARLLLAEGQPEAAMMIFAEMGSDVSIDIDGYWKKHAKANTFGNAAVTNAFAAMGYSGTSLKTGINGYVREKIAKRKFYSSDKMDETTGKTNIDSWVEKNQDNRAFSQDPLGPSWSTMSPKEQQAYPGGWPSWRAQMVNKALNYEVGLGEYGRVHRAMKTGTAKTSLGNTSGDNKKKVVKTPPADTQPKVKTKTKTKSEPVTKYGSQIQDVLKDVYKNRREQIGMTLGRTPKFKPKTLENNEKMRKASLVDGKKDLERAVGTMLKGRPKYGGTVEKALDHFVQFPRELERIRNTDMKHYIMNELNKREAQKRTTGL